MNEKEIKSPEGKKFYGSVTVSERGQIVIPVEARRDFNIKKGDKLVVLGDLEQGIGILTFDTIQKLVSDSAYLFKMLGSAVNEKPDSQRRA